MPWGGAAGGEQNVSCDHDDLFKAINVPIVHTYVVLEVDVEPLVMSCRLL